MYLCLRCENTLKITFLQQCDIDLNIKKAKFPESFNANTDFVWFDSSKAPFIWHLYIFSINSLDRHFSLRQPFNVKGFQFFDVCGIVSSIEITFDSIFEMKGMGWPTNVDTHLPSSWTIFQ